MNITLKDYNLLKQLRIERKKTKTYNIDDFVVLNIFDEEVDVLQKIKSHEYYMNKKEEILRKVHNYNNTHKSFCNVCNKEVFKSHYKSKKHLKNAHTYVF